MSDTTKVWFITGASAGLGRAMTETVLANGDIAVATLRKPEALGDLSAKYSKNKLLVVRLDVTNPQEIKDAFKSAVDTYGRVDVVYNNAGYGILGEKAYPRIRQEAVHVFRDVNKTPGGRLINVASVNGVDATPDFGFYSASKAALINLADGLSAELDPKWNIKITSVNPGAFKTRGVSTESLIVTPVHPAYTEPSSITNAMRGFILGESFPGDADKASAVIFHKLANDPNPPLHLALGHDAVTRSKDKQTGLLAEVEKYEEWSNDLVFNSEWNSLVSQLMILWT